jgi:probable F420-dependent oxidoreductase
MLIDAMLTDSASSGDVELAALNLEEQGYAGLWSGEGNGDPFLQLLLAAGATSQVTVGTAIAIAFARSPMTTAYSAFDLARYSRGRFILGLGTQIRPHIEQRFSMPWSKPVSRMREYVAALRAIWSSWQDGARLDFRGDFYSHTLMPPFFSPRPHEWGQPPIYLSGVGSSMTELAGEAGDGFLVHPFTTLRYACEVTLPALERGRIAAGHEDLKGFDIALPVFLTVGRNEAELAAAIRGTKKQIAFYASTPSYRSVLAVHGWDDLQPELTRLSKQGQWRAMGDLIDDEMLSAFAVVGNPDSVVRDVQLRWGEAVTRISLYIPYRLAPDVRNDLTSRFLALN